MWKKWIGVAAFLIVAWAVNAQEAGKPAGAETANSETIHKVVYVVQPQDTLWDVARRFLNSPYYWPKIWERNSFIINPNLIYPGDVINLYPETEKLYPGPTETVPTISETNPQAGSTAPAQSETKILRDQQGRAVKVIYKQALSVGWIEPGEFEKAGKIIKNYDDRDLIGAYDHVWIDVGGAKGVKVGDVFSIFKVACGYPSGHAQENYVVTHPVTHKKIGYKILNVGELKILSLTENAAEAEVQKSYYETELGDYIRPYQPPLSAEVPVIRGEKKANGYIVATRRDTPRFGQNDVVYIDLGKAEGIETGVYLKVYIPGEVIREKSGTRKLPDKIIGQIVVLDPRDHTSVALVTESTEEFMLGYMIRVPENK